MYGAAGKEEKKDKCVMYGKLCRRERERKRRRGRTTFYAVDDARLSSAVCSRTSTVTMWRR